ncbi:MULTISPECIES: methionine gamma-lyase [Psychrilyobacter]|uniref:L-methionine gamma-lyase n=3 Tax=Psychrilyobacter TaxID=623282 RepID=A0ABX9KHJ7_9FUSO|nr:MULTISPECIES: methionine gamma-lyase [Psychrilyobacter]NDI77764.1 methionine gamma-lyase [Psychrilyobacter piezotolerans]RDE61461.1 methionine gamma-lyase [Psychrilyobacter sp. S5]REI40982.1 methionine gamma-lyase [Psychrilyobacter piezotolerans]
MKGIQEKGFGTKAIHGGSEKNPFGTLATPIYQSSTFVFDTAEQGGRRFALEEAGYIYSRLGNPTSSVVEGKLALLEGAEAALATSSGMGAISSTMWTLLKAGDHVLADKTLYGCTYAFLSHGLTKFGIDVEFVDTSDLEAVKKSMRPNTRIVYLETPANPNLKIVNIKKISEIAHENKDTLVVVDNTFATPYLQNPIKLGADLVVHSATKYLNGHGDVVAGFVAGDLETVTQIRLVGVKDMTGSVLSPQDAFLMIRGMKTLELRMERHCSNAGEIAEFLDAHPMIEKVYYPGLESHEGHEIAKEQMNGFGGIIAFDVKGGIEAGKKLLNSLELCTLAVSLGDTETLIQHPASMTHSPYTREERLASGITDGLVRISVGLEGVNDIIDDLKQGLEKI